MVKHLYEVKQEAPSYNFKDAWSAAGQHIDKPIIDATFCNKSYIKYKRNVIFPMIRVLLKFYCAPSQRKWLKRSHTTSLFHTPIL